MAVEDQFVAVETSGPQAGRTFTDDNGAPVTIATGADARRFESALLRTLNGEG